MIRIESYLQQKSIKTSLFIYENEEEFAASGNIEKDPRFLDRFDYFKSDDGYYIPVLTVQKYKVPNKHHIIYTWFFPLDMKFNNMLYVGTDENGQPDLMQSRFRRKSFYFTTRREVLNKPKRSYLNANESLAAELIAKGVDIHDAFRTAFPNSKDRTFTREAIIRKALNKPGFIDYIMEKSDMNKLKEALNDMNVHEKAAQSLIELLEAKTQSGLPNLNSRKYALEAYINIERMAVEENKNESTATIITEDRLEAKFKEEGKLLK